MRLSKVITLSLLLFFIYGCAAAPIMLENKDISRIKKIMIVSELKNERMEILDHTGAWDKSSNGQLGLLGALVEGVALSAEVNAGRTHSLGGDPAPLKETLNKNFIRLTIDDFLKRKLSEKFEITFYDLAPNKELPKTKLNIKDIIESAKKQEADIVLHLNIIYGLAIYKNTPSSAAIDADVTIFSVYSKEKLMEGSIRSDQEFCKGRYVDDFMADHALLYKQDMEKAMEGFADRVALLFVED